MKLPSTTKYAPIPHPDRKPSVGTILNHISTLGWVISIVGLAAVALLVFAACRQIVSWTLTFLLVGAFVFIWYRLIFREAGYEVNGELIDMGYNDFPSDSSYR